MTVLYSYNTPIHPYSTNTIPTIWSHQSDSIKFSIAKATQELFSYNEVLKSEGTLEGKNAIFWIFQIKGATTENIYLFREKYKKILPLKVIMMYCVVGSYFQWLDPCKIFWN